MYKNALNKKQVCEAADHGKTYAGKVVEVIMLILSLISFICSSDINSNTKISSFFPSFL